MMKRKDTSEKHLPSSMRCGHQQDQFWKRDAAIATGETTLNNANVRERCRCFFWRKEQEEEMVRV